MDHSQCEIAIGVGFEYHSCRPVCPHGVDRGYEIRLTGNPAVDRKQRLLALQSVDLLTCADAEHADAMPYQGATRRPVAHPDIPVTRLPSGRAWRCDTGCHRWHRSKEQAQRCAFVVLPMVQVGGSS